MLAESNERPVCLPGSKDEPFLPSISSNASPDGSSTARDKQKHPSNNKLPKSSRQDKQYSISSGLDDANNNLVNGYNDNNQPSKRNYEYSNQFYASAPASESSTPFKLPSIDRSKSNSVSSLASERYAQKLSRGRSQDRRARLCRSPSCPSNLGYWNDEQEPEVVKTPETARFPENQSQSHSYNSHSRPYFTSREDSSSSSIKLPSIFGHRHNSSFTLSSTANSSAQPSRDTSPFAINREATILSISRKDLSPDANGMTKYSPRYDDDELQRSGTQSSALLLPISTKVDMKNCQKSKRKRKKMNGLVNGDNRSDAERLLREKLGAIERRDINGESPIREMENMDLSDTIVIERVREETSLANTDRTSTTANSSSSSNKGARESKLGVDTLASKPPIYQNTPTRIKTEKKVASVKA